MLSITSLPLEEVQAHLGLLHDVPTPDGDCLHELSAWPGDF